MDKQCAICGSTDRYKPQPGQTVSGCKRCFMEQVDILQALAQERQEKNREPVADKSEDKEWQEYLDSTKDDWDSAANGPIPF